MAAGDLITSEWQLEYNGLLLGEGTDYDLVLIEGLIDAPPVRTADLVVFGRNGVMTTPAFLDGRTVRLTVDLWCEDAATFSERMEAFLAAFSPTANEPMVLNIPGLPDGGRVQVTCVPRRRSSPIDLDYLYRIPTVVVEMFAADPLIYSTTLSSGMTTLEVATVSGLTWPLSWPLSWGGSTQSGTINATNNGNTATPVVIRIDGPVTDPTIENVTTGSELSLSITVETGDFLLIDSGQRSVLLNGTASRYSTLDPGSTWFDLEPGLNTIRFAGASSTAGTLSITWRSAWL